MRKLISAYLKSESGSTAVEYALILAIVGVSLAVAMFALRGAIAGAMDSATARILNPA